MSNSNNTPSESNDAESKQKKHSSTPSEHLVHLLNIGWSENSPLIQRYVAANSLHYELSNWVKENKNKAK